VALTVLVAFLLPIVVFVIALGGLDWWLEGRVAEAYDTPVALVLALAVTIGSMLIVRRMARRHA
jgi:predicted permease